MRRMLFLFSLLLLAFPNHYIQSGDREPDLMKAFENSGAQFLEYSVHIQLDSPVGKDQLQRVLLIQEEMKDQNKKITFSSGMDKVESVDISLQEKKDVEEYYKIKEILEQENIQGQYLISITGNYDKEVTQTQMKEISSQILNDIGAKYVEGGFIRESFLSTSAYTSLIPTHITTGKNKININIALKYNPSEKKTKLILATPLIYGDY